MFHVYFAPINALLQLRLVSFLIHFIEVTWHKRVKSDYHNVSLMDREIKVRSFCYILYDKVSVGKQESCVLTV